MRCDCTGEPPGELITTATVGSLEMLNARSIGPASAARARPGRRGVAMPMSPLKRSTGTMGPRLNNDIDRVPRGWAQVGWVSHRPGAGHDNVSDRSNSRLASRFWPLSARRARHIKDRAVPQYRLDRRSEASIGG